MRPSILILYHPHMHPHLRINSSPLRRSPLPSPIYPVSEPRAEAPRRWDRCGRTGPPHGTKIRVAGEVRCTEAKGEMFTQETRHVLLCVYLMLFPFLVSFSKYCLDGVDLSGKNSYRLSRYIISIHIPYGCILLNWFVHVSLRVCLQNRRGLSCKDPCSSRS